MTDPSEHIETDPIPPQTPDSEQGVESEFEPELVCNCNDEFRTSLCPVHDTGESADSPGYVRETILLTDKDITDTKPQNLSGHFFWCTKCDSQVMHDMVYCPGCGSKLIIQSKIVTAYINQLAQQIKMRVR